MFWILFAIVFFIFMVWVAVVVEESLFPLFLLSFVILLIGLAVSDNRTYHDVLYSYGEKIGTEKTQMIGKIEYMYVDHNGDHKTAKIDNVKIEDSNGEYYIEYQYVKSYNKSFFKYKMEELEEVIKITLK